MNTGSKIGFIFGGGNVPLYILQNIHKASYFLNDIFIIDLSNRKSELKEAINLIGKNNFELTSNKNYLSSEVGNVFEIVSFFKKNQVENLCIVGAVPKPDLKKIKKNLGNIFLLLSILLLKNKGDNNILLKVERFLENKGFNILGVQDLLPETLCPEGPLTIKKPTSEEIEYSKTGVKLLEACSEFDVGQACTMYNGFVIGIEGIEGTDELIKRSSFYINQKNYEKNKIILIKLAKKNQSAKLDFPVIGIDTIKNCLNNNFAGIILVSSKIIIINIKEVINYANQNNFFIYGL